MNDLKYPQWVVTPSEQRLYDSFPLFALHIWNHLGLPTLTWLQADIGKFLQDGPRRRIVEAFRGVGKSWLTAVYVMWLLYRDPQHKIMVVSASSDRANAFSVFVKRLIIDVPLLRFLQPRDDQRTANIAFDVGPATPDQTPSVKSVGITGQLTGGRADTIVADDVEIPKNSLTETQREKLSELVKEFDAVLKPDGQIIYLGTPQTEESLYNILPERGYVTRVWPALFTSGIDAKGVDRYKGCLAPVISNTLADQPQLGGNTTEPTRFSDLDLKERELSYGRSGFALQFMLDTTLSDAEKYPLKIRDLICMDLDPKRAPVQMSWGTQGHLEVTSVPNVGLTGDRLYGPMWTSEDSTEYQGCAMFIDPAGRGKDETAYAIVKQLNSMLYIVAWGGFKGGYERDTLTALSNLAKRHGVNYIGIEGNFGDGMFTALFEPVLVQIHPCTVEEYKVTGQKELRVIDKLEPAFNQHRVVIDRQVAEDNATDPEPSFNGLYQLSHITKERNALKHDDRIDILAEAVGYWMDRLRVDTESQEKRHKNKLLMEELKEHAAICKAGGHVSRYEQRQKKLHSPGPKWSARP